MSSTRARHRLDARFGQRQPVDEGGGEAARRRFGEVAGVGGEDFAARARASMRAAASQRPRLLLRRGVGDDAGGGARLGADLAHRGADVGFGGQDGGHGMTWRDGFA